MTKLEEARLEVELARKELLQSEHQLTRAKNRVTTFTRKQNKARTHRLIIEGAELEYVFDGIENLSTERFREFMQRLSELPMVQSLYEVFRPPSSRKEATTNESADETTSEELSALSETKGGDD